ncbi:MAG: hypothetical protein QW057_09775 [Candidatus Bathyarchaeia archaeon]
MNPTLQGGLRLLGGYAYSGLCPAFYDAALTDVGREGPDRLIHVLDADPW